VKPVADNSFFMQLDDSTTLLPVNMKESGKICNDRFAGV